MKSLGEKLYDACRLWNLADFVPWDEAPDVLRTQLEMIAVSYTARLSEPSWRPIDSAPKDGSLILACQRPDDGPLWFKAWEQWKAPQTISWRGFHVNAPGKRCWRDAKGSPLVADYWMPLDRFSLQSSEVQPSIPSEASTGNAPRDTLNTKTRD